MVKDKKIKIPLRRLCIVCDKMYNPSGKFQKVCDSCMRKKYLVAIKKRKDTFKKTIKRRKSNIHYD